MSVRRAVLNAKYHLGMASRNDLISDHLPEREHLLSNLPLEHREEIRGLVSAMQDLNTVSDVPQFYGLMSQLHRRFDMLSTQMGTDAGGSDEVRKAVDFITGSNVFGYQPQGARAYRMFINPLQVCSFFAESYSGFAAALNIINSELLHDGFRVIKKKGVSQRRHAEVLQQLLDIKLAKYRRDKARHRMCYGNDWTLVEKSFGLRQPDRLRLLIPDRIWPVVNKVNWEVDGWSYQEGYGYTYYPKNMLWHGKYDSLRYPDVGIPPAHSVFMDMEADMSASSFNMNVFHRGGLIGMIIAMEDPGMSKLNHATSQKAKNILREEIKTQYSGGKAGMSILVSNYIKEVHKLTNMNTLDAAFPMLRDSTRKILAIVLQIPFARMGVSDKSSGVYSAVGISDQSHVAFDKAMNALTIINDGEINEMIADEFGIDDHIIRANGRFNSFTLAAAQAGYQITKMGALLDKNTMLDRVLGMPPFHQDDPRGYEMLDNSENRKEGNLEIPQEQKIRDREESIMYSEFDGGFSEYDESTQSFRTAA